ncbi:putative glycosyltransferase EpsD [Eubacterium plexicaudatum ASF492]|uniref:Glycosyltransferase subfamily 4-like N-terminal domain-containing protein n=1 Tax=Eubacterium plexicaudatum ASF492 TaxID=1235802 RepID=N2AL59_9FIRM|nr:putative glycosyltransferase EpsD [Eubacterium plexicaudatum ASF492]
MQAQKKRVLILASVASMIDQFNIPNIQLLLEMGYDVHVACNFEEGNTCSRQQVYRLRKVLLKMHVPGHQWDCPRSAKAVRKCCRAYYQLLKLSEKYHFSWMHCHSPVGGVLARMAAHKQGIKIIYTAHGFHFYRGAPIKNWLLYYPVEKLLAHWTDVLLTVNKEDYCLAKKKLKAAKIVYLKGVGIDVRKFQKHTDKDYISDISNTGIDFRKRYRIPEHAAILLSVGELSRRKNHQMVISAMRGLAGQEVHYIICGQGKLKNMLMRKAKRAKTLRQIHMVGFQENVTVFYRNADIFVFPSKQEGLPVALMEAMACGLPCIVSDIRGNRDLVADDKKDCGGIRFSLKQPQKLQEALNLLIENPQLRDSCRRFNQEKIWEYDLHIVMHRMEKVYRWLDRWVKYENSSGVDVYL